MDITQLRTHKHKSLDLRGRTLTVTVGSTDPVTFSVHEHLICRTSDYFKTAMKAYWDTSTSGSVTLKEEDPEVFEVYLHWLYCETLPVRNDSPGQEGNNEYIQLAQAYVLGEMLQDVNFKDAVLDAILIKSRSTASDGLCWYPVGPAIRCIYEGTPESSAARRLLVDMYTCHGHEEWLTEWANEDDLPKQFLLDLAIAALKKRPQPPESLAEKVGTCEYHEHLPGSNSCYMYFSVSKRAEVVHIASCDTE
ncbi:uncharacterized protein TrAFT101_008577 [Trichoderma asperellum]|uniref:BTB domain-containing protein n=1 Tax=Trichoderma asperellum (strain ATCC 204424 / CBS 433.97 / NBRC 101777) TaxID=1042311 RepID=A0A2T3ZC03_TRIA4|nr:hypothetical protein M441DRAFT_137151 [Trichoderma asperellum CBS 433.97]PTB42335.1 hypothetical protein M441DRAFT_137151 [Trichoderma asperellum CBS 433.97]UKZ93669.1 hypothetical protein TrAFT101_008577 [Trichoderma asperellum]